MLNQQSQHLLSLVDNLIQETNFLQGTWNLGKEIVTHVKNTRAATSVIPNILGKFRAAGRHLLDVDRNHAVRRAGIEIFRTPTGKIVRLLNKPIAMVPVAGAGIYGAIKASNLEDTVTNIDTESKANLKKALSIGVGTTALGASTGYLYGKKKKEKEAIQEGTIFGHATSLAFNPFVNAYFTIKSPLDIIKDTSDMSDKIQQVKSTIEDQSKNINGIGLGIGSAALGYHLLKKRKDTK